MAMAFTRLREKVEQVKEFQTQQVSAFAKEAKAMGCSLKVKADSTRPFCLRVFETSGSFLTNGRSFWPSIPFLSIGRSRMFCAFVMLAGRRS